jgi:hypothetical protein
MAKAKTRPKNVPVFVSSTFTDMQAYRRKVRDALTQQEVIVRGMEQFGARPGSPVEECLKVIRSCRLYIGVFGMRYGSVPDGYDKSMTHLEYDEAQRLRLPSLIYLLDEDHSLPTKHVETGPGARKLRALKKLLKKSHTVSFFTTPEDLQTRIMHDVPFTLASQQLPPRTRVPGNPYSYLRAVASVKPVCARWECTTELMGDIFLHCTYDGEKRNEGSMSITVNLYVSTPITSRITAERVTEVVLFEVGRAGATATTPGVMPRMTINLRGDGPEITFSGVHLGPIGPGETRVFQISNLRCDCSHVPRGLAGMFPVWVFMTMTGAAIEDAQQQVAHVRKGLDFEVRTADNTGRLPDAGFVASQSAALVEQRIVTLRFTEGFVNAFKPRLPIHGCSWNTHGQDPVSTGESSSHCAALVTQSGVFEAGLADCGTRLEAEFSNLPAGTKLFVSVQDIGYERARLLEWQSTSSPGALMMEGHEVKEVSVENGRARAIWDYITPFYYQMQNVNVLEFAVFASIPSDATSRRLGTSTLQGGFAPAAVSSPHGPHTPIPLFSSLVRARHNFLTIVP